MERAYRAFVKADLHRHQLFVPGQDPPGVAPAQVLQGGFSMMYYDSFHFPVPPILLHLFDPIPFSIIAQTASSGASACPAGSRKALAGVA